MKTTKLLYYTLMMGGRSNVATLFVNMNQTSLKETKEIPHYVPQLNPLLIVSKILQTQ